MDLYDWFREHTPAYINAVKREKEFICHAIFDVDSLKFQRQDYIIKDIREMVKTAKKERKTNEPVVTPSRTSKKNSGTRWIDADIRTKEHKTAIRTLAGDANYVLDVLVMLVDEGYDLVVKRANEGSSVRTILFCNISGHIHDNCALSAVAPDAWLSLTSVVYKHDAILKGVWLEEGDSVDDVDDWK